MARKKLPQEILDIRGTARKGRLRPKSANDLQKIEKWSVECTAVSGYKTLTDRAKRIFKARCLTCISLKILEPAYLDQLLAYAREYDLYLECSEDVKKRGRILTRLSQKGEVIEFENPSYNQAIKALNNARSIGSDFGMTPIARQNLKIADDSNPLSNIKNLVLQDYEVDEQDN